VRRLSCRRLASEFSACQSEYSPCFTERWSLHPAGHTKWVTSVAWEPAHVALPCRRLASGSRDNSVRVWDAQTRRCLFSMGSHTKAVSCVRWTGDGHIISSARDCAIFVWDAQVRVLAS